MLHPVSIPIGESISLTPIHESDRESCVELLNNQGIYKHTMRIPQPYQAGDFDFFFAIAEDQTVKHGHPVHFAIRDETQKMIGGCGFDDVHEGHSAEIGYWLGEPHWGRGIMTDVVREITSFAHAEWQLVRVSAYVFDFNQRSSRVLEKAGYEFEGSLMKFFRKDGRFIDAKLYASLR